MTEEKLKRFQFMQATAYFEGRWRECRHAKCRAARRCKGGPRGTFARFAYPDCFSLAEAAAIGAQEARQG